MQQGVRLQKMAGLLDYIPGFFRCGITPVVRKQIDVVVLIFIIGGAQIYALALSVADRMYLTKVYHDYQGDTSFPEWNADEWQLTQKESFECGEKYPHPFAFETYNRK